MTSTSTLAQGPGVRQYGIPTITLTEASRRFLAMSGDHEAKKTVSLEDVQGLIHRSEFGAFLDANKGVTFNVVEVLE